MAGNIAISALDYLASTTGMAAVSDASLGAVAGHAVVTEPASVFAAQAMMGGEKEGSVRPLHDDAFSTPDNRKRPSNQSFTIHEKKRPRVTRFSSTQPDSGSGGDPFLDTISRGDTSSAMLHTGLTVNTQVLREVMHIHTNEDGVGLAEIDISLASVRYNRPLNYFLSIYRGYRIVAADIRLMPWSGYHKHTMVQAVQAAAPAGGVLAAATSTQSHYNGCPLAITIHQGNAEHDRYKLTSAEVTASQHPHAAVASYTSIGETTHGAVVPPKDSAMPAVHVHWSNPITESHDDMHTGFVFPLAKYHSTEQSVMDYAWPTYGAVYAYLRDAAPNAKMYTISVAFTIQFMGMRDDLVDIPVPPTAPTERRMLTSRYQPEAFEGDDGHVYVTDAAADAVAAAAAAELAAQQLVLQKYDPVTYAAGYVLNDPSHGTITVDGAGTTIAKNVQTNSRKGQFSHGQDITLADLSTLYAAGVTALRWTYAVSTSSVSSFDDIVSLGFSPSSKADSGLYGEAGSKNPWVASKMTMSTNTGYTVAAVDSYATTPAGTNALGETEHGKVSMTVSPLSFSGGPTSLLVSNCYVQLATTAPYAMTVFAGGQTVAAPTNLVQDLDFPLKLDGFINAGGVAYVVNSITLSQII